MKKLTAIMLMSWSLWGCTSSTKFGTCIGAFDDKKPNLEYKVSKWNAFLGIFFFGTIIVPIWVVTEETLCPVGEKQ